MVPCTFEIVHLCIKVKFQRTQEWCHLETGFGKITAMERKRMVVGREKKALRIVAKSEVLG